MVHLGVASLDQRKLIGGYYASNWHDNTTVNMASQPALEIYFFEKVNERPNKWAMHAR